MAKKDQPDAPQPTAPSIGLGDQHDNMPVSGWSNGTPVFGGPSGQQASSLIRGCIVEAFPEQRGDYTPFRCFFMYNPTDISVNYGLSSDQLPADLQPPSNLVIPNMVQGVSVGFSLFFDRMMEVYQGGPGPGTFGVMWDIRALERLMGMYDLVNGSPMGRAVIVYFGAGDTNAAPNVRKTIQLRGFFTSLGVTYATFDKNMTPTRCKVDINISTRFLPADSSGAPSPTAGGLDTSAGQPNASLVSANYGGSRVIRQ